ncbi:cilia- and flagella-associated protein 53-like [Parasteatoda tepidariorum]|uniref:cilia- and flagella-associated protein 53-like n=1 Tax=Parasteatoda tepidariorum TaxID=114398 RepID=UPI001C71EDCC|nr:cilia- and flagella-associated protein 53-like [Parasteatoda tepidariorum]
MQPQENVTNSAVIKATCYCPCAQPSKTARASSSTSRHMTGADRSGQAIRDYWKRQDFLDQITDYAQRQEKELIRNQWEHEAERKAFYSRVQWEMDKIKGKMEEDLEKRRKRLSDLLKEEEAEYLIEESTSFHEDPGEKQQRMLDRYCELKTQKERKRQQIVLEKKEQQFKLNCDELRTELSKKMQRQAVEDGKRIIRERQAESEQKIREEELYEQLLRMDCEAKRQKEEKEEEERKKTDIAYSRYIEDQREAMKSKKLRRLREKEEEAEIMAEQKRLMELEELCEREKNKRKQEEMRRNLDSCLREKLKKKSKEVQDDLLQDLFFIMDESWMDVQIMDDKDEKERNAKKRALMKEQQEYLKYLKDQMKKEDDFEKEIDKLYQDELDEIWKKRQNEWDEEKQKRRQLEQDVMNGIKEQIQSNIEKSKQVFHLNESYAQLVMKEVEEDKKRNAEKLKLIRERNERHQNELLNQIREKQERLKEEKRLIDMELEVARCEREDEETKIQKLLSDMKIDHEHPYRMSRKGHNDANNCCSVCNNRNDCNCFSACNCCSVCK